MDEDNVFGNYVPSVIGLSLMAVAVTLWSTKKQKTLPPGPTGLPILGYRPFMSEEPYKKFIKLSKIYNSPVISLYLGNRFTVILNNFASLKEAMLQDACLGRPHGTAFELSNKAISLNDVSGPTWRDNRRTTVRILKELGFDKSPMDTQCRYEVQELIQYLKSSDGRTIDFHNRLTSSVSNMITSLVFGERLNYDDGGRRLLDNYILTLGAFFNQTSLHACFPWLKKILYFFKVMDYDKAQLQLHNFLEYVQNAIDEHRSTPECGEKAKDYIDGYLKSMANKDCPSAKYLSTSFLRGNIRSLFGAGTEPGRCTLEWCFLCMAHFQEYQKKVHEELDSVLGGQKAPGFSDSISTPLTQAVIYEVIRWIGLVPFGHVRAAMEDTTIQGHFVPKNSVILMNFYAVHHDTELWGDPEVFRPERFINEENKPFRPEYFIPFGLGKRSCPGEAMVYIELYVYFATVMQSFWLRPPEGQKVSFDAVLGIAKQSKSPRLRFLYRQESERGFRH